MTHDDFPRMSPPKVRLDKGASEVLRALASGNPAAVAEAVGFQRETFRAATGCFPEQVTEVCPECSDAQCPLWLPLRAQMAHADNRVAMPARSALERAHNISDAPCTVCGGVACDMFFCYVTEK